MHDTICDTAIPVENNISWSVLKPSIINLPTP